MTHELITTERRRVWGTSLVLYTYGLALVLVLIA